MLPKGVNSLVETTSPDGDGIAVYDHPIGPILKVEITEPTGGTCPAPVPASA